MTSCRVAEAARDCRRRGGGRRPGGGLCRRPGAGAASAGCAACSSVATPGEEASQSVQLDDLALDTGPRRQRTLDRVDGGGGGPGAVRSAAISAGSLWPSAQHAPRTRPTSCSCWPLPWPFRPRRRPASAPATWVRASTHAALKVLAGDRPDRARREEHGPAKIAERAVVLALKLLQRVESAAAPPRVEEAPGRSSGWTVSQYWLDGLARPASARRPGP